MTENDLKPPKPRRDLKLNQELIDKLCQFIKVGGHIDIAVAACGITKSAFYLWLKLGQTAHHNSYYAILVRSVHKAVAEAEMRDVARVDAAGNAEWRAAAWKLERRSWQRWGRRDLQKVEITGEEGGPIKIEQKKAVLIAAAKDYVKSVEDIKELEVFE